MGLFDFSLDNLDDPNKLGLLAMGLQMMAPKQSKTSLLGDIGQSGMTGLQTLVNAKQQERANRQSDIQTLTSLQQSMTASELPKMLAQGNAYVPPPALQAITQRLNDLAIAGNLSGKTKAALASYQPPQAPVTSAPPSGMAPPSSSPMANPDYQPMQGAQSPAPQAQAPGAVPTDVFGVPLAAFAAAGVAKNQGISDYLKALVDARKPVNARPGGTVYGYDPKTGQNGPLFYAPKLDSGIQPTFGPNGQVSTAPVTGYKEALSDIEGAKAAAVQKGKQGETYVDVDIGGGQKMRMTNAQYEALRNGGLTSQAAPIPQSVIDADNSGQPFNATQTPNGQVSFQRGGPSVAQVTPIPGIGGGLGVSPSPAALAGAVKNAESGASNRQKLMADDYQNLSQTNSNAQTVISRLQTIKQLGPQAITGAESEKRDFFNGLLSLVGVKSANDAKTAGDLVDKNAAQIALAIGAGSNGTDALRSLAQVANPSRHMTVEAMGKAVDSLVAPMQMSLAKGQMLTPHFSGGDTSGYFAKKQAFDQAADPRVWELQNLPPQAQQAYVQSLSPSDAKALLAKRQALKQIGVLQ